MIKKIAITDFLSRGKIKEFETLDSAAKKDYLETNNDNSKTEIQKSKQHRYWESRYKQAIDTKKQKGSCSHWVLNFEWHIRKRTHQVPNKLQLKMFLVERAIKF